jgi:DNA-binding LacI/PurR family transcriptional regulator
VAIAQPFALHDMTSPIKLKDLAASLGLSISTVARALGDSPRIGKDTTMRVKAEAQRQGYVVDLSARAMRQGTSSLIGFIAPDLQNDFYSTAARAVSMRCQERGLQMVVAVTNDDPDTELTHVRNLYSSRVKGIVLVPGVDVAADTRRLLSAIPHVQLVRQCENLGSDWFGIVDEEAMRLGVEHLASLGHRRIGYIGSTLTISTGAKRLAGFRRALRDLGLDEAKAVTEVGGCDAESGYEAMRRILLMKQRPTGIVTAGARICVGAYSCARERGVDIPRELSFVGFADAPALRWWGDGLTTIGLPVEDIATAAMDCLLRRAENEDRPSKPMQVMHRPTLIVRSSTASPPGRVRRMVRQRGGTESAAARSRAATRIRA